ncbi:unnamed protein product [Pleuronectes platessa]|uniref:Uncharacterized protein n=1 Tax=Pleuronectes platessa TaxID=8262 RepID=A0A9N7V5V3_PLEPL|nr:unnamed protein product [Pleuronectes platessa]
MLWGRVILGPSCLIRLALAQVGGEKGLEGLPGHPRRQLCPLPVKLSILPSGEVRGHGQLLCRTAGFSRSRGTGALCSAALPITFTILRPAAGDAPQMQAASRREERLPPVACAPRVAVSAAAGGEEEEEEKEEEASVGSCELSGLRNISALAHIPIREPDPALLCGRGFPRLLKQQLLFTFPSNVNHRRRHIPPLALPPLLSPACLPPSPSPGPAAPRQPDSQTSNHRAHKTSWHVLYIHNTDG